MTILDEGRQLKAEVARLRPDKRRRYGTELRDRILDWLELATTVGMTDAECGRVLGIKSWRLKSWRSQRERSLMGEREPMALIPVEVPQESPSHGVLITQSGIRVEGLTFDQILIALRRLS